MHPGFQISIHALREEGDTLTRFAPACISRISIHALREEGDPQGCRPAAPADISIHALREEGDLPASALPLTAARFLSTPSARRATSPRAREGIEPKNFYPRPPRGGRHNIVKNKHISLLFLSTPSARRAT